MQLLIYHRQNRQDGQKESFQVCDTPKYLEPNESVLTLNAAAAIRRAVATSSPSGAPTAQDVLLRTRLSRDSQFAIWSSPLPSVRPCHIFGVSHAMNDKLTERCVIGDISDASVFPEYTVPKMYLKLQYCVSCAIHGKIVR